MTYRSMARMMALSLAGGLALMSSALAQQTLRLGSGFGDRHSSTRALASVFSDEVAARTANRYKVALFAGSQLGQAPEMINQAQSGINFGVYVSSAFFATQVPQIGVTNLPFVFANRKQAFTVLDGAFGDKLREQFRAKGLEVLGFMELGFRNITNSRGPIKAPADVNGLKIRLQNNPVHIATFKLLGASPVSIDASEMFAALSQGVVDGQENPYAVIASFALFDAKQKYLTDTGHFFDVLVFAVSKALLDKMTPQDQAAFKEAGRLATLEQRRLAETEDAENLAALRAKGMQVTILTPQERAAFQTATQPVYSQISETLGKDLVDSVLAAVRAAN